LSSRRGQENLPTFAKEPMRFAHDGVGRVDVLDNVGHHHAIEGLVWKRQLTRVGIRKQRAATGEAAIELVSREPQWQKSIIHAAYRPGSLGETICERSVSASDVQYALGTGIQSVEQHSIPCRQDRVVPGRQMLDLAPVICAEPLVFSERAFRAFVQQPFLTACS
jgi:hypothetical protein